MLSKKKEVEIMQGNKNHAKKNSAIGNTISQKSFY